MARWLQGGADARWVLVVAVVVDVVVVAVVCCVVVVGGSYGLIVLRHAASLLCHQGGSHSSVGAVVRCSDHAISVSIDQ